MGTTVRQGVPQAAIHLKNSYGAETPVTDGDRVYALFGTSECLPLRLKAGRHGRSASNHTRGGMAGARPHLRSCMAAGCSSSTITRTIRSCSRLMPIRQGNMARRPRRKEQLGYSVHLGEHRRTELIAPGSHAVRSYDLDGKPLWSLQGMSSIDIPTPCAGAGLLFISSGYVADKLVLFMPFVPAQTATSPSNRARRTPNSSPGRVRWWTVQYPTTLLRRPSLCALRRAR